MLRLTFLIRFLKLKMQYAHFLLCRQSNFCRKNSYLCTMKYIVQFLIIIAFWALGIGVSFLTGGVVPGSVLGMVFLFTALALGYVKERQVEQVSKLLIKYMVLFFLPASVGVVVAWQMILDNFWAIAVATIVSTVLIIVAVGLTQQKLGKRW